MIARRVFLALFAAPFHMAVSANPTMAVVLRGRLDATQDEADDWRFTLTAANLDQPLVIESGAESYLSQYLDGCIGHAMTMTLEPQ